MSQYIFGGLTGGLGTALWKVMADAQAVGRANCDLVSEASVKNYADTFVEQDGTEPIHLMNLTGLSLSVMLHKQDEKDWQKMLDLNLLGNARLLKHFRKVFKAHPGSSLTMVGSVTVRLGPAGTGIYTASKSALEGLVSVAAHELAPFARVNLIELGYCDVGIIRQVDTAALIPNIPLGRLGTANDLAEAWKFCMNCQYLTGAIIPVNGGLA